MSASSAFAPANSPVIDSLLAAVPNPVVCIDREGIVRLCNDALLTLLSRKREEVLGRHVEESVEGSLLTEVLRTGKTETWQRFCFRGRAFLVSRLPLFIDGQLVGAFAALHEISELEQISGELKSYRLLSEELEGIIEASLDGIYVADGQGVTLRMNESFRRISGLTSEEVLGFNAEELVERKLFDHSAILNALESGAPCSLIQKARSGATIMISANPFYDATGKIVRVVAAVRDLTELNRLKDELSQADCLKHRYEKELKQFRRKTCCISDMIIAKSASMNTVLDLASRVSTVDSTVLILGESGVGKEMISAFIHRHSPRCDNPFVKINCTAIPEQLLESELFGYVRGAFTGANKEGKAGLFEAANGGTLLLDEIGDLSTGLQAKLLRVIQEKQTRRIGSNTPCDVDVRILAATNQDLSDRVDRKLFRKDLYYRLNVVPIQIPPLRRRKEDILPMATVFLKKHCKHHNRRRKLHRSVFPLLLDYAWPGNVRELENVVERLVVTARGDTITIRDLPPLLRKHTFVPPDLTVAGAGNLKEAMERVEAAIIKDTLAKCRSTRCAAKVLGVNQSTVVRKAKMYGLTLREENGQTRAL
jgi:PAS domain S-box-containing protein